jgi:hypothetical protein
MEFEGGISGTFTMHGHSHEEARTLRIDGSQATLLAKFGFNRAFIEVHHHRSMQMSRIDFPNNVESGGHGGGDYGIMRDFVLAIQIQSQVGASARDSLESHIMAFAAEESRLRGEMIDMEMYRQTLDV